MVFISNIILVTCTTRTRVRLKFEFYRVLVVFGYTRNLTQICRGAGVEGRFRYLVPRERILS